MWIVYTRDSMGLETVSIELVIRKKACV